MRILYGGIQYCIDRVREQVSNNMYCLMVVYLFLDAIQECMTLDGAPAALYIKILIA